MDDPVRLSSDPAERWKRAMLSLEGLSVGDALGERFFGHPDTVLPRIEAREIPAAPWRYTDDTEMALGILEVIGRREKVDPDELAGVFARRYGRNPSRGYGPAMHRILGSIGEGAPWRTISKMAFGGAGSMGNGGAMRTAPLGAYFADDPDRTVAEAVKAAEVTHAHPEGIAGAVGVAVASAEACLAAADRSTGNGDRILRSALDRTPNGDVRDRLAIAMDLGCEASVATAAGVLGNGSDLTAPGTVPFALWCAARHCRDYREAFWTTVSALGDRDTTCAIVGGIVALSAGRASIPTEWIASREALGLDPGGSSIS